MFYGTDNKMTRKGNAATLGFFSNIIDSDLELCCLFSNSFNRNNSLSEIKIERFFTHGSYTKSSCYLRYSFGVDRYIQQTRLDWNHLGYRLIDNENMGFTCCSWGRREAAKQLEQQPITATKRVQFIVMWEINLNSNLSILNASPDVDWIPLEQSFFLYNKTSTNCLETVLYASRCW